ncbi:MAG: helix-turn-helix transcriptional regulator [Sporichthyaceae bacterium]|nr:helix-turn-helix transcriptional regulator [Sporichthyaceae bacterium]
MPTSPSSSAQKARQALADRLRDLRLDAGLTARALSQGAGWHEAKTSRIEHGQQAPSPTDLRTWSEACGVPHLTPDLIAELRAVDSMWLDWQRAERTGLRQLTASVRDLYEGTRLLRSYSPKMIPGLLQTAEYTTAVYNSLRDRRGLIDDVEPAVAERMARQHILYEGDHRFAFVIEQSVLRYRIGGPEILAGQLRHLALVMRLPSVSLSIIPDEADRSGQWLVEDFTMFDTTQVSVELVSGLLTITQPREIAMYVRVFTRLAELAVTGARAREVIDGELADLS